jgi:hypothetical protein
MIDVQQQIDDGDITPYEAANQLALITMMVKKLNERASVLKPFITGHLDAKEHLTTQVGGTVTYKRGAAATPKVKDLPAYGAWLFDHGEEELTVHDVVMPVDAALTKGFLEALVEKRGEVSEGVEYTKGSDDTVSVSLPKDWVEKFEDPKLMAQSLNLLGIEAPTSAPVGESSESKEALGWEEI